MAEEQPEPDGGPGSLRPIGGGVVAGCAVAGLVIGLLIKPVSAVFSDVEPVVTWWQTLTLVLVAAVLSITAWLTWRTVHVQRLRLLPHQAVNRLALARACALVGPLVGAAYLGYGLTWIGSEADLAGQRVLRSGVAALAGVVITVAALLLERACRVRKNDPTP